jgi:hypothetical protein
MSKAAAAAAHERLARHLSSNHLTGFDPLESLISPAAAHLPRGLPQQIWLRAISVSGRAGLALARVPQLRMVKTLALVVLAQRILESPLLDTSSLEEEIQERRNFDGGWGYEFDAQFRWGRYSAGASNAVVTAFVVEGASPASNDVNRPLLRYMFRDLLDPRGFFRYYAGSPVLIHNANALMCRAAARVGVDRDIVLTALDQSLHSRNAQGLWVYGDRSDLGWADTYHNAYIAWVLQDLAGLGFIDSDAAQEASDAWLTHFFDPSGLPKLHDNDRHPTSNVNAVATALFWLCTMREPPKAVDGLVHSTAVHLLRLQRADGSVGTEGPRYPRWNDAPALVALAALVRWFNREGNS